MQSGYDALKRMAQMAKNRLRNKVNENNNKSIKSRGSFKILYGREMDIKSKIITKEDAKLYEKVRALLTEDRDVVNPIAKLIDYKVYNNLSDSMQERYLLELVGKYKQYKSRFEEERGRLIV